MARRATPDDAAVGGFTPVVGMRRIRSRRLFAGVVAGFQVSRRTLSKAWEDRILGMSAESAFWQLLSLPSALIALLAALGYVAHWLGPDAVDQIRDWALSSAGKALSPRVVDQVASPVVNQILSQNHTSVIGIGTIIALWSGSSATATFVNTITIAYGQRDLRGAVRSRLVALRLYLFTVLAGAVVLPAVVFGPGALDRVFSGRWHDAVSAVIHTLYWPVLGVAVFAGISIFYHLSTPVRLRWRRAFPGAAVALMLFLALSYGLQVYIAAIATNLRVYSTLAAPILTLMYFYALGFAVLLGAEFNAALEERWPRGTRQRPTEWLRDQASRVRSRRAADENDQTSEDDTPAQRGGSTGTGHDGSDEHPSEERRPDESGPDEHGPVPGTTTPAAGIVRPPAGQTTRREIPSDGAGNGRSSDVDHPGPRQNGAAPASDHPASVRPSHAPRTRSARSDNTAAGTGTQPSGPRHTTGPDGADGPTGTTHRA